MKPLALFLAICFGLPFLSADAATYKLLHAFSGGDKDGRTPTFGSSLTPSGSVFYGMTEDGGKYTNGVVFKINQDGSGIQILHTFDGDSILNMGGSTNDGAYPMGTPVLGGATLYGMTQQGGPKGYVGGTVFSVNIDGSNFKLLHGFGGQIGSIQDGWAPYGSSLTLIGSTLFGLTSEGGSHGEGTLYSINTDGSNYLILHSFAIPGQGFPQGSLFSSGTVLYGMTQGSIFQINTNGSGFQTLHIFAGASTDGANAYGSVVMSGSVLYGMTHGGGANSVGCVFAYDTSNGHFQLLHSFATTEAFSPFGDLALSGSTLYGMTSDGVTNYRGFPLGSGAVFEINKDGSGYQILHTFLFPLTVSDGSLPYGTPLVMGSALYGMTSLGGSSGLPLNTKDGGAIFELTLSGTSSGGGTPPTITTISPLPGGELGVVYHQQLAASGGATPYTWAVSAGKLPAGLTLSASGVLSGKPTAGGTAGITIQVTGHDKLSSSQAFILTVEAPPALTVTTPKANAIETSPTLAVTGTATGSTILAGVFLQLNGGSWVRAQTANGFTTWTYPNFPLMADSNVLSAYAVDTSGHYSPTNIVKFTYFVTGPLTVKTNGSGTFTPNDNGKNFQIGASFTITATPAKKFVFTDWTDGLGNILSSKAALKFVMSSNLTLIANFTAAPKVVAGGSSSYSGYQTTGGVNSSTPPSGARPPAPTWQIANPP